MDTDQISFVFEWLGVVASVAGPFVLGALALLPLAYLYAWTKDTWTR